MNISRSFSTLIIGVHIALLSACASNIPLDEPAPSSSSTSTQGNTPGSGATSAGVGSVARVDTTQNSANTTAKTPPVQRSIYFDYDSFVIKDEYKNVLESNTRFINNNKTLRVVIEGNTDERGGREYNLALGQKRAEAVKRAMTLLGVPENQIEAISFGKEKPKAMGSNEAAWAENRRSDINYR